ncbi:Rab11 family-interacting protein 3 [Acanthisitta chloris]|uniref:Rab11 family-interacting protein 3 n=1 Tax=Acanthisitta chloris TaxID=57068 RepID=A0A091MVT3_9PASS|nr:Rab11 family-interacting protein 3 [Acanthisitta chloris]
MLALIPVLLWVGVVCICYRQLHQTSTLAVGVMEESYQDTLECTDEDITDKVVFLEKRVTELEKDTAANGEQHSRLKQENLQLVHR